MKIVSFEDDSLVKLSQWIDKWYEAIQGNASNISISITGYCDPFWKRWYILTITFKEMEDHD